MVTDLNNINEFYTMKGYERIQMDELTNAMEDYLETVSYTHLPLTILHLVI